MIFFDFKEREINGFTFASFVSLDECMTFWDDYSQEYGTDASAGPDLSEENREFIRFFEDKYRCGGFC